MVAYQKKVPAKLPFDSFVSTANDRVPVGTQTDVVYSMKSETCQDKYAGDTMRALEVQSKEHRDAIRLHR